ncbi:MAG TPA: O-antigen ligase family protein [Gemmatimonadales bacterium]|nr:O-antigen ligase family protein [Gemmatimonadales bacterium]
MPWHVLGMNQTAFWALLCFVFVLPWDPLANLPVLGSIPRIVGLAASGVGVLHILARRRVRELSWFHLFAALFVLWAGVSTFWSLDPAATRARVVTAVQLLVMVWLIWEIAWSPERQRALLQAYVLGVCVAALATIHNYWAGSVWLSEGAYETSRFAALKQDPNELGVILALGLPMAWYLGLAGAQRPLAWLWRLYLPLGLTGILLTASRAAFLTALVALGIVPWTLGRVRLRTKAVLYALAVGSLLLAAHFVPDASLKRIQSTRADIEAGYFGGRIYIWLAGLQVAREHPLAGVGAGAFGPAVAPTLHREMASHQTLLEILVEQGVVGLLLFLAMVASVVAPLRHLPVLERRLWLVVLASLALGSLSLHLAYRKQFWFVFGLLAAAVAWRPAPVGTGRALGAPLAPLHP